MSPLLEEAQRVHDVAGLTDQTIAAATGAKPSTVRGWLSGRSEPTGERAERLIELAEMIKRLALIVRPESIAVWLKRPILALDDESTPASPDGGPAARPPPHRRGHMDQARTARSRPARTSRPAVGRTLATRRDRARALPRRYHPDRNRGVVPIAGRVGTLTTGPCALRPSSLAPRTRARRPQRHRPTTQRRAGPTPTEPPHLAGLPAGRRATPA
jgi:hypothetical protein